jgi:heterotetrameric sarcosine oxidase gamma subunit
VSEHGKAGSPAAEGAPVARSPIAPVPPVLVQAGWEVSGCRSDAPLTITDCTPLAKVQLKAPWNGGAAKALGVPFGRAGRVCAGSPEPAGDGDWLAVGSGPREWLMLAPPGPAAQVAGWLTTLAADAAPEEFASVTDLTHGRALMRITGPDAADLLARLCGADLHDEMAPDGAALRAPVAGVATDIVRDDINKGNGAGVPSYLLHCERSSGQYLFGALAGAGEPLGIGIDGFRLPGI